MKLSVRDMILIAMFAALTAVGAFIRIPIPYISVTMQFFFTALAGIILGAKKGALSQLVYVLVGLVGFPIFTQGGGLNYVFKPSFGYLIGFIAGAYTIGKVIESFGKVDIKRIYAAVISGTLVLYLIGVPYSYMIIKFYLNKPAAILKLIQNALLVTIPKDLAVGLILAVLTSAIMPRLSKVLKASS
jgi:biotin transport system substrate-specific component